MVAKSYGGINVKIDGEYNNKDIQKAIRDLKALDTSAKQSEQEFGKMSKGMKLAGAAVAAAAAGMAIAVGKFAVSSVSAASDLEESQSKVTQVFGDQASQIISWADSSATAFGQSKQQALEAAGTFGNLLRAFGSTQSEAQEMSQRMVELAADLASFNNTSVDDALNALRSGLSGETEPLKRFGVAINDARLKTVALEKGLYSGKGTLDVYAKSVAAYELILKDTTLAQGDFERTSDGLANTQRILAAAVENAKAEIGQGLVRALQNFSEAAGGPEGMANVIDFMAERIGLFVEGVAIASSNIDDLGVSVDNSNRVLQVATENYDRAGGGIFGFADAVVSAQASGENQIQALITGFSAIAQSTRLTEDNAEAQRLLEQGYMAASRGARDNADATDDAADAALTAEEAVKALKDQVNALKGEISNRQAFDDFQKSLADLDKTLEGNKRTFQGMSDAAFENRETLRTAFSDIADIVQGMVDEGKISADEFESTFAKMAGDTVDEFVKNGFKRSDVRNFLKSEDLWLTEFNKLGDYAKAAGVDIGDDLLAGMKGALSDPNNLATLRYAARQTVAAAETAARKESETQSPSKKWKKLGDDLVEGLIVGLGSKKEKVKEEAREIAQGIIDAASEMISGWDQELNRLEGIYDDALAEFNSFKNGISSDIFGGLDLGAAVDKANETGGSVVDAFTEQANGIGTFAQQMIDLTKTNLSESAWLAVQQLGAARGSGLAAQMLSAQGQTTIDGINQVFAAVEHMANAVGEMAAKKWYGEGVANAQSTYEGFKANFGKDGPARKALMNLMDNLANAMNRTATITVTTINRTINRTINEAIQARAKGGPVAARQMYLVGEEGPELFVPNISGSIVPNGDLPSPSMGSPARAAGGVTINVNAGMGTDGRQVGRQIVEALKQYERSNGPVPIKVA